MYRQLCHLANDGVLRLREVASLFSPSTLLSVLANRSVLGGTVPIFFTIFSASWKFAELFRFPKDKKWKWQFFNLWHFCRADSNFILFFIGKIADLRTADNRDYAVCYPFSDWPYYKRTCMLRDDNLRPACLPMLSEEAANPSDLPTWTIITSGVRCDRAVKDSYLLVAKNYWFWKKCLKMFKVSSKHMILHLRACNFQNKFRGACPWTPRVISGHFVAFK